MVVVTFCQECGARLEQRSAFGKTRGVFPRCGHVYFDDPKVAVGVVIDHEGLIVLVRRGHEPQIGRWSFPSGYIDAGETLEGAAVREAEEETGLRIRIDRLIGAYSEAWNRTVFVAYAAAAIGGEMAAGGGCIEGRGF